MNPKTFISILLCILALVLACEGESEKKRKEQLEKNKDAEHIASLHEINYRQPAVLLSLKYDLAEEDVFKILLEYDSWWSEGFKKRTQGDRLSFAMNKNEIIECAQRFNTLPKTIAALIIDFESMKQKEK